MRNWETWRVKKPALSQAPGRREAGGEAPGIPLLRRNSRVGGPEGRSSGSPGDPAQPGIAALAPVWAGGRPACSPQGPVSLLSPPGAGHGAAGGEGSEQRVGAPQSWGRHEACPGVCGLGDTPDRSVPPAGEPRDPQHVAYTHSGAPSRQTGGRARTDAGAPEEARGRARGGERGARVGAGGGPPWGSRALVLGGPPALSGEPRESCRRKQPQRR